MKLIRILLAMLAGLPTLLAMTIGVNSIGGDASIISIMFLAAASIVIWFVVDTIRGVK
jgi:hypothetical protein